MAEPTNLSSINSNSTQLYDFEGPVCDPHENPEALQSQTLPTEESASVVAAEVSENPSVAALVQAHTASAPAAPASAGTAPPSDPLLPFNPVKMGVGAFNGVQGLTEVAVGVHEVAVGLVTAPTGVGVGVAALGSLTIAKGCDELHMAYEQITEAVAEDSDDAAWQNLLGVVPFVGTQIDDPGELF